MTVLRERLKNGGRSLRGSVDCNFVAEARKVWRMSRSLRGSVD